MLNKKNNIYTKKYLKENIKVLYDNDTYRVADCINNRNKCFSFIDKIILSKKYNNTILKKYCEITQIPNYYLLLYTLIKYKFIEQKKKIKYQNDIVVHIRGGDDLYGRGLGNEKNYKFYIESIKKIGNSNIPITIVVVFHYGVSRYKFKKYDNTDYIYNKKDHEKNIELIHKLISSIPNPITIISNKDVDLDLVYLSFSNNLITSNHSGGFSKIVKRMNLYYKNEKYYNKKIALENINVNKLNLLKKYRKKILRITNMEL